MSNDAKAFLIFLVAISVAIPLALLQARRQERAEAAYSTPPGDARPIIVTEPAVPPPDHRQEIVSALEGLGMRGVKITEVESPEPTGACTGIPIMEIDGAVVSVEWEALEWTRESWDARPDWSVDQECFSAWFRPSRDWLVGQGQAPPTAEEAWETPGVAVTFGNIQRARCERQWWVVANDEPDEGRLKELEQYIVDEGGVIAALLGYGDDWSRWVETQPKATR